MENEKMFSNGHGKEDIEPDPISEQKPVQEYFDFSEIATEEDDTTITADNVLAHIEVRKPGQQEFFQVHPDWQFSTRVIIDKRSGREVVHLLHKSLMPWSESLEQDSVPVLILACINLKGRIFLWVIRKSKDGSDPSNFSRQLSNMPTLRERVGSDACGLPIVACM